MKRAYDYLATYGLLAILAVMIIVWTALALILFTPLPRNRRRAAARYTMMEGFRLFSRLLTAFGAYQLDLDAIETLRGGPPMILAPNHPTSIDAILFLARHPDLATILKPALMSNFFLGAGARLAGFIRSEPPRRMIREAVAELDRGGLVLLFPEGTRTTRAPLNPLTGSAGVIARHARVPIQLAIIETDSPYLSKGWTIFRVPRLPIRYRVRLGKRLEPTEDADACTLAIERELTRELAGAPQNDWLGKAHLAGRSRQCPTP
ncbi:MAG TPA: lysophospholipid acyltransferase family protein [Steroidobacteraceae bacterium]|nr:lysophospholipid acyltransferase family protein [Steroidobacteraceae bacterium]